MMIKTLTLIALAGSALAWEETCTQFKDIYADGTELCEKMWADSFVVIDDSNSSAQPAYDMWFFDMNNNPNVDVMRALHGDDVADGLDQCHLKYFHKDTPGPEDEAMTECHPWKNRACCNSETVPSPKALNEAYGEGYEWDRCGPMTEACQRFFVMEACLYECEPAAGLYRKYNDSMKDDEDYNEWQLHKMPIKKSFCDSWYTACYNDYFCGKGDYFECQAFYEETVEKSDDDDTNEGLIIGLIIAGVVALIGCCCVAHLIMKERSGKPMFAPPEGAVST